MSAFPLHGGNQNWKEEEIYKILIPQINFKNCIFLSACSTHGWEEKRKACKVLVRKPEGKRPLGRSIHRWEDNIKLDLRDPGWGGKDWTHLACSRTNARTHAHTHTTRRHIPEDDTLHNHRWGNLKSYIVKICSCIRGKINNLQKCVDRSDEIQQDTQQKSSEVGVHRNTPTTTKKGDAELI
jgi:hypothetical protein